MVGERVHQQVERVVSRVAVAFALAGEDAGDDLITKVRTAFEHLRISST